MQQHGAGSRHRQLLRDAQQRAAGARIALELGLGAGRVLRPMSFSRGRAAAGTTGRCRSAGSTCDCALHEVLHRPILERMEADHREAPAGAEHLERRGKTALELAELVVDVHAQRLEGARRRMLARLAGAHRAGDQGGELRRARDRLLARAPRRSPARRGARSALRRSVAITWRISSTPARASHAETGSPRVGSMRMSSGPSARKLKPRPGSSSCGEETPRSKSTPRHGRSCSVCRARARRGRQTTRARA